MATDNPLWGEERIANELLLKLGIRVSPRTVRKYMPKRPPGRPRGDQRWATFLRNHAKAIIACDFFVAVTVTFQLLYVFVLIHQRMSGQVSALIEQLFDIDVTSPTHMPQFRGDHTDNVESCFSEEKDLYFDRSGKEGTLASGIGMFN